MRRLYKKRKEKEGKEEKRSLFPSYVILFKLLKIMITPVCRVCERIHAVINLYIN